ncbi:hypothetical protein [Streptomyces sp. NPDC001070]
MTLGDWFDYWMECVVKPYLSVGSYETYEQTVRLYLRPRLGHVVMFKLGVKELRAAMTRLAGDKSSKTAKHALRVLSASLTAAMEEDFGLTRNVAKLVHVRAPTDSGESWDAVQVLRFLARPGGGRPQTSARRPQHAAVQVNVLPPQAGSAPASAGAAGVVAECPP